MINTKDLHSFYDELKRFYIVNREDFVNVKIDNVIAYAKESKNYGTVIDMIKQRNTYLPFNRCLLYGRLEEENLGEVMIYFLCFRVKHEGIEYIKAGDIIKECGKIVTEFDESDAKIYHGKHGVQLIDMFIAQHNKQLIYAGGRLETYNDDYKLMNSYFMSDKDSQVSYSEEEESSLFVYYLTALEFLHCKNVKVVNKTIPEKLKRAQIKRSGRAKLESGIIKVYPYIYSKDKTKRDISIENFTNERNAPYYTRGHFRTYTEEAKLFGKYTGTYFISPHWRGRYDKGNVKVKDYELIAPIE